MDIIEKLIWKIDNMSNLISVFSFALRAPESRAIQEFAFGRILT